MPTLDPRVKHQVRLERVAITQGKKSVKAVRAFYDDIRALIAKEGEKLTSQKALRTINLKIREAGNKHLGGYTTGLVDYVEKLTIEEAGFSTKLLTETTKPEANITKADIDKIKTKVNTTPLMLSGKVTKAETVIKNWPNTETQNVVDQIITGFYRGETNTVITRNVRQQLEQAPGHAESISRTLTNHVATITQEVTNEENEQAVQGYILTAVLDSKTSEICRGIDGTKVRFSDDYQPLPPFHINCRTITRPWLRADLQKVTAEERAATGSDGTELNPINQTYYQWLANQDAAFQDEVLGVGQGAIFRSGAVTPEEFRKLTQKNFNKPMTLAELEAAT